MPEGDSVYLLARRLDRALKGRRLVQTDLRVPRLATRDLAGWTVVEHATHGKHLLTRLTRGGGSDTGTGTAPEAATLHSHLLMDGSWSITGSGKRLPARLMGEVRVRLGAEGGVTAWGRHLHQLELVPTAEESSVIGHLGPDPLRADWDADAAVRRLLAVPETPLVAALLDQTRMAGLGNLWANELAFVTGTSPWTPIGELDVPALVDRAARALRHSAHTPNAYQVTTGLNVRGESHWVSGRYRRPCLRCGTPIRRVDEIPGDHANRVTWWCPSCQPGPERPTTTGSR